MRTSCFPGAPSLLLGLMLGCGGKVVLDSPSDPGAGAGGSGGSGGECFVPTCVRFPEGDANCAALGLLAYGCNEITATPKACAYTVENCTNCLGWCCPEDISGEPTFAPAAVPSPQGAPPAGCSGRPEFNWICQAQGKPLRAVSCDVAPTFPETGCLQSPYDGKTCSEEPIHCCP